MADFATSSFKAQKLVKCPFMQQAHCLGRLDVIETRNFWYEGRLSSKMRVASSPFPHFELIGEYEATLLNLQFDDLKAVFCQKKATGEFITPKHLRKHLKSSLWANWKPGGFLNLHNLFFYDPY
jgi:hypothetical protein